MISVEKARYEGGYRIWLRFNTAEEGTADLSEKIKHYPIARPLLSKDEFKKFYLDEWPTIAWPCGFDLTPETLYELVTGKPPVWCDSDLNSQYRHDGNPQSIPSSKLKTTD